MSKKLIHYHKFIESSSFSEWIENHSDMHDLFNIVTINNQITKENFNKIRIAKHNREKEKLVSFLDKLEKKEEIVETQLFQTEHKIIPPKKTDPLYYQNPNQNLSIRILHFLRDQYYKTLIQYISDHLNTILTKMTQSKHFSELFLKNLIPEESFIEIKDSFFSVIPNKTLEFQVKALHNKYKTIKKQTASFKVPPYIKNPKSFFRLLRDEAHAEAKSNDLYFPFLSNEIGFSAYLFSSISSEGNKIDKFIDEQEKNGFQDFGEKALALCKALVPPTKDPEEFSISIQLFFRQISERAYSKISQFLPHTKDFNSYIRYTEKPMCEILPSLACLPPFPPDTPLRYGILFDPMFNSAISNLTDAMFMPCILDALHYVSQCIESIRLASLETRLGREPTTEEMNAVPPFEESFSLSLGALLSAEPIDICQFGYAVQKLTPLSRLSPNLEFAATYVTAVFEHVTTVAGIEFVFNEREETENDEIKNDTHTLQLPIESEVESKRSIIESPRDNSNSFPKDSSSNENTEKSEVTEGTEETSDEGIIHIIESDSMQFNPSKE